MATANYLNKFKLLLDHTFEGKIVLNESDTERLLHCLSDCNQNSPGKLLLDSSYFSDLIFNSVANINNASISVQILLIKIVTILFKNELQFSKIQMQDFQNPSLKFCVLSNLNSETPPDLHLACIKLVTMQTTHLSGVQYLLEHEIWRHVLYPDIQHKPKQISTAAYKFIAKLVWKLHEYNLEAELLEVLGHIVNPILACEYLNVPVIDAETDTMLSDKMFAHLSALSAVVCEVDNYAAVNNVITSLKEHFIIDLKLFEIFLATKNPCLLKLLNSFIYWYCYGILRHLLFNNEIDDFCNKMTASYRNYIIYAIQKREPFVIIDFVVQCNIMWSTIEKTHAKKFKFPLTFERNGNKIDFSLQIIIHLMVPMVKNYLAHTDSKLGVIEEFVVKMGKYLTDYIYTCCYSFTTFLEEVSASNRRNITIYSLKELLRLKGHLNKSQTGTLFQCLYYLLEMFISRDESEQLVLKESPVDPDDLRLLSHLLNALKMLLKEYHISWYENVEIVTIQADLLNLLKQNFLTTKHVVLVLDVLDICVQKFLSPNMSLLVDIQSSQSNTLNDIGKVIRLYTQYDDWEVRESAYNLLHSCMEISYIKYVPLQKVITGNSLMILAAEAGLSDRECYSQCTALKCLGAATKINSIWHELLVDEKSANIYMHLVFILRNHTEGMVRTEAANVLTGVYTNQKIAPRFQCTLYEVMMTAALDDLHWEVQLAALNFWKQVIHKHFTNKGMLDGKFPSITFSKEKRKIIVLDEKEIQKQLTAIMNDLADIGCLTVLSQCMNELHITVVIDQAYLVAKELVVILDRHNFQKVKSAETQPTVPQHVKHENENENMDEAYTTSEEERNKVIDSILSEYQSDLIMNLHDNYDQIKTEEMDIDRVYDRRKQLVDPNNFLDTFQSNNYSLVIKSKKKCNSECITDLEGLLDEILNI